MMLRLDFFSTIVALLALLPAIPAHAQETTDLQPTVPVSSTNALALAGVPQSIALKDLDGTWQSFHLSGQAGGDMMSRIYSLYLGGGQDASLYYTQGHTAQFAGQWFLIAYHAKPEPIDYSALMRPNSSPAPKPLTPDSTLTLCLINVNLASALDDLQPFDMRQALAANSQVDAFANAMIAGRRNAQAAEAESNLKQVGLAMLMYTEDNNESFPPMKTPAEFKKAVYRYVKSDAVFIDPVSKAAFIPNPRLSHKSLADIAQPADMVAAYDPTPTGDGQMIVLFADGHVKMVSTAEWASLKKASKLP